MTEQEFVIAIKELGIEATTKQLNQLEKFYNLLVEWNKKINLTRIIEKDEVYLKHFYDESPQLFFKALVCIFKKVKPTDMRPQEQKAIALVADELFTNPKRYTVLNEELMELFDDIKNDVDVVVETKSLS